MAETKGMGEIAYGETGIRTGGLGGSWVEEAELAVETRGVAREVSATRAAVPAARAASSPTEERSGGRKHWI